MTVRLIPDRVHINRIDARVKLPAEVWKAVARAEAGDLSITNVLVTDGDCNVWLFSPRKYDLLMDRIRDLEAQLYDLREGDTAS